MQNSIEFYALPDEQCKWLNSVLDDSQVWCVLSRSPPDNPHDELVSKSTAANALDFFKNEDIGGITLFIGLRSIVPAPVWRESANGVRDLDFIESRAIKYEPSRVFCERILLEGQFAIMRDIYYLERNIDSKPLYAWFLALVNSLKHLRAKGVTVVQSTTAGSTKEWPQIVVTDGAERWWRGGSALKQFPHGEVEFNLKLGD
jgi:hypothetical protein